MKNNITKVNVHKISSDGESAFVDDVSVEEPLEIRINAVFPPGKQTGEGELVRPSRAIRSVAITMRTPGNDEELAAGFLFTEGIISSYSDIEKIALDKHNTVTVTLHDNVSPRLESLDRHSYVASSCGVCGKRSIAAVMERAQYAIESEMTPISKTLIASLPTALRQAQHDFDTTGGIHASALFDCGGRLLELREDVGRHNALDKLIGARLAQNAIPLRNHILLLSGRASFELIQKSAHAGIPLVAAVGAPSSLAIDLAEKSGMTLIGFVRQQRFNVYTGKERVEAPAAPKENLCKQPH